MFKPTNLRQALTTAVSELRDNPQKLRLSLENGQISSTLSTSLSFENCYTLTLAITAFSGEIEAILVPIQAWLREYQADIMTSDRGRTGGFTYHAEINGDSSIDVNISLMLTERTLVKDIGSVLHYEYAPEPAPADPVTRPMELYVHGELISRWEE
jgi:hypothetical protein